MAYQVLARKWRPQRFEDVVGQAGVTRTLQNAITGDRVAQAFVFAGPRGVGKTTSARILAKALNCAAAPGPTPEPCGSCEACVEIAEGRDMDVLEIDAATHTQVDKVREVIISGLSMPPVRDRYRVFIIDEVHQLSSHSFNALLKSIEEPPPHVVFMMATTELQKIPETIISRSQVHEFRTISERAIAGQLRKIATAEGLQVDDGALALIARAADGSMRDGLTAFDQVLAFAGTTITTEDVSSVLGLVGRDLLLDIMTAVADEAGPAAFELAGRAIESGYDLRLLCRELSRLVRDLMLVSVDPKRLDDPEVVPSGERERVRELLKRFSREDLLRAFDLIARAEVDLRAAAEPRYHLEMALLKWIHLRKLVPLAELIEQLRSQGGFAGASRAAAGPAASGAAGTARRAASSPALARPPVPAPRSAVERPAATGVGAQDENRPAPLAAARAAVAPQAPAPSPAAAPSAEDDEGPAVEATGGTSAKDALLAEIRRTKLAFYRMTVAQADRIEVQGDRVIFSFAPAHKFLKDQLEREKSWLEPMAAKVTGRRMQVVGVLAEGRAEPAGPAVADDEPGGGPAQRRTSPPSDLKAEALADPEMKTLLELLPLEIRDVEKM